MGSIKDQIDADLKQAMLAGDKTLVTTLRGLKSAILNAEIAKNVRGSGLGEDEVTGLLSKEAKKRQESADLYKQGGGDDRAEAELAEKTAIEKYLPQQMTEAELSKLVEAAITETAAAGPQDMGRVIGAVKQKAGASADGALIARLAKEKLQN